MESKTDKKTEIVLVAQRSSGEAEMMDIEIVSERRDSVDRALRHIGAEDQIERVNVDGRRADVSIQVTEDQANSIADRNLPGALDRIGAPKAIFHVSRGSVERRMAA